MSSRSGRPDLLGGVATVIKKKEKKEGLLFRDNDGKNVLWLYTVQTYIKQRMFKDSY